MPTRGPSRDERPDPGLVEFDGGLRLRGASLWLDARRPVPLAFVSDARAFGRHQRVVATDRTARLLAGRLAPDSALSAPVGRPFSLGSLRLELVPAGRAVGSAQLLIHLRGCTLLYCAGFCPGRRLVAEPYEPRRADVLLLGCPYDAPPYLFPPRRKVEAALLEWVGSTLAEGRTPVLLAGALGTAQEISKLLANRGIPARAHSSVARWNRLVRACGLDPGNARELRAPLEPGREAVVAATSAGKGPGLLQLTPRARLALVSGRAVVAEERTRVGAETGFELSSHADARALRRLVRESGARYVYLSPGHTARFEAAVRRMGIGVTRFAPRPSEEQLDLFDDSGAPQAG